MPRGAPQAQAVYRDGTPIPDAKVAEALKSGEAGFMPGSTVTLVGPDGTRIEGPAEKVPEAIAAGYRPESAAEKKMADMRDIAAEHPILSRIAVFGGRAASAGTLGQSDVINRLVAPEYESGLGELSKIHPGTAVAGEVAGMLATAPAGGVVAQGLKGAAELTGAARIAAALGEAGGGAGRAAVTLGSESARGALEVGTYSAGQELARASMADDDITAERLLTAFKEGASIGALGGVGFAGAGLAARKVFGGPVGKALGGLVNADSAALRSIGARGTEFQKLSEVERKSVARVLLGETELPAVGEMGAEKVPGVLEGLPSLAKKTERIEAGRSAFGKRIGELVKSVDEQAGYSRLDRAEWLKTNAAAEPLPSWKDFMTERMQRGMNHTEIGAEWQAAKEARAAIPSFETASRAVAAERFPEFQKAVGDYLGELRGPLITGDKAKILKRIEKNWLEPLQNAQTFEDIQAVRRDIAKGIYTGIGKTTRKEIERGFERTVESAFEAELEKAASPDMLALYKELKGGYSSFAKASDIAEAGLKRSEGKGMFGLTDLLAGGLGIHTAAVAGGPAGLAATLGMEALWRGAKSDRAEGLLARALDAIRGGTDTTALKLGSAVEGSLLDSAKSLVPDVKTLAPKVLAAYQAKSEAPRQALNNPALAAAHVDTLTRGVTAADPELGRKTQAVLQGDMAWLQQRLPATGAPTVTTKDAPPRVAVGAASSYVRAERALSNPVAELERLKEKRLTPELVSVLHERRPKLLEQVQAQTGATMAKLTQEGRKPDYPTLVRMSLVTGTALHPSMKPEAVQTYAAVWAAKRQAAASPAAAPSRVTPEATRRRTHTRRSGAELVEAGEGEE